MARAAQSIGRDGVGVLPQAEREISTFVNTALPVQGEVRECFAPLIYSIPAELIAAERAAILGTPYFRDFGGGRTVEWSKEGASRIRDSHMQTDLLR